MIQFSEHFPVALDVKTEMITFENFETVKKFLSFYPSGFSPTIFD